MAYTCKLIPEDEMHSILPLVKLLNPDTDILVLEERLKTMLNMDYQCMGIYDESKLIGICGIWILCKLYNGLHIEPDNVVVDPAYRDKGIGELLMQAVTEFSLERDIPILELNCYVDNIQAQKFWAKNGFQTLGYHMQKKNN